MIQKTYGVYGLMEWQPIIYAGHAKFCPQFVGGMVTAYGVTPAKYTTSDTLRQRLIENSPYYQSGRISLLYQTGEEELKAEAAKPAAEAVKEAPTPTDKKTETMKFASTGDAQNYLCETFGLFKSDIRSKVACISAAAERGLTIEVE